jgi:hypothetical protein
MLAVTMSQNPTYRINGDDWDPPAQDDLEAAPTTPPAPGAKPVQAASSTPSVRVWVTPAGNADAAHPSGWATPAAATADAKPVAEPGRPAGPAEPAAPRWTVAAPRWTVAALLDRIPPPIGPAVARIPPRLLLGGGGIAVAAILVAVVFASSRPPSIAPPATAQPTPFVPLATASCVTPTLPLAIPDLTIETPGDEPRRLAGFGSPEAELDLEGPWPAELGAVESNVLLGSSLRLSSGDVCIAEWRAIAAHPPASSGKPWRPDAPESLTLGWQHADRVAWQPSIPLPPRGEWIIRLTVWYRDATGARAPTPAPVSTDSTAPPAPAPGDWVVERYYRIVVEARDS